MAKAATKKAPDATVSRAPEERAAYAEARALVLAGKAAAAEKAFRALAGRAGPGLAAKARMALADVLLEKKDWRGAEELLRQETERLLSAARRSQVAGIYLSLAERAHAAKEGGLGLGARPDFDKALRLYGALAEQDLPRAVLDRALAARVRVALAAERYADAEGYARDYLERLDPLYRRDLLGEAPGAAEAIEQGEHGVEVRLLAAEAALRAAQALPEALERSAFGQYCADVSDWVVMVLDTLLVHLESKALDGGSVPEPERRGRYFRALAAGLGRSFTPGGAGAEGPTAARRAVAHARDYLKRYPGTSECLELARLVPQALLTAGFADEAREAFDRLLAGEGLEPREAAGRERLARYQAQARYFLGQVLYGQGRFDEARDAFQRYLAECHDGGQWREAQEGVWRALGAQGLQALAEERWDDCRAAWAQVAAKRGLGPEAPWLALASATTWLAQARAADKAGTAQKAALLFRRALDELGAVARRWPGEAAAEARVRRAEVLRHHLDDLEGAVREYREAGSGAAAQALGELTAVELALESPRVFRSSEEAHVLLRVRNVPSVTVRRYPVDLEDYFRKFHSAEGVERLDLDLVSPDRTWTVEVPGYREYADLRSELPLAVEKPGAYAVTVEGKDFEATVLVVKSDLELLAATTREEALVLVKDGVTEEAVPRARVRLWTGERPGQAVEVQTGADGVARARFALPPDGAPAVLAVHGAHVAVSNGALPTRAAVTVAPRGFVYASRPVYLPGEVVPVRGVLRAVVDGAWAPCPGAPYVASLTAPDGRLLLERAVELGAFGSFTAELPLPAGCPLGTYTVTARHRDDGRLSFSGALEVQLVQPSKLFVEVTPSSPAALAGDRVTLTVKAAYYTGAPLVDRVVSLELPDGRCVSLVTDRDGLARYELDTTPFFRSAELPFLARLAGEDVVGQARVALLPAAVVLGLTLPSAPQVVGGRLDVAVALSTPDGKPAAEREVRATVYVQRRPPALPLPLDLCARAGLDADRWASAREDQVLEQVLMTDARGAALLSYPLGEAGPTRVAVTARDDQGREVTESRTLTVGRPASPALALEVERATLSLGDRCPLRVVSTEAAGLGLMVWTGSSVVAYDVTRLRKGVTAVSFAVGPEHAPSVTVVALATGERRLHRAEQTFRVRQKLTLEVEVPDRPLLPGEAVDVVVRARDGLGRPARAELSLGLVDRGLLARYADLSGNMASFFEEGLRREVELTACSSVTFRRLGQKRAIAREVVAEAERLDDADQLVKECEERSERRKMDKGGAGSAKKMAAPPRPCAQAPCPPPSPSRRMAGRAALAEAVCKSELARDEECLASCADMPCEADDAFGGDGGEGGGLPARRELAIGAFWVGAATTDERGEARVKVVAPERTTAYRVQVRAVTAATEVGEEEAEISVRRELYADLKLPAFLLEGDVVRPVVVVQNAGDHRGAVAATLTLRLGAQTKRFPLRLDVTGRGAFTAVAGPFEAKVAGELTASVDLAVGDRTVDRLERAATVRPFGLEEQAGRAGELTRDASFRLELSSKVRPETVELVLELFPGLDAALLDLAERPAGFDPGLRSVAARVISLAALTRAFGEGRAPEGRAVRLRSLGLASVPSLIATQRPDGSWPWLASGLRPPASLPSDRSATAWAVRALEDALALGWLRDPAPRDRGVAWLQGSGGSFEDGPGLEALVALAGAGRADFSVLNRLQRSAASLPAEHQALLGLALVLAGKDEYARPIADGLAAGAEELPVEARSLALLLLGSFEHLAAARARLAEAVGRDAGGWGCSGAQRWLALAALAAASGPAHEERPAFTVEALVNGAVVGRYEGSRDAAPARLVVAGAALGGTSAQVDLRYRGRGRCAYRARLTGFAPTLERRAELAPFGLDDERWFHSPRLYRGRQLAESSMRVERVAADSHVEAYVGFRSRDEGRPTGAYVSLTMWLPAGATLDRTSLPSEALAVEEAGGRLSMVFAGRPSDFRLRLLPSCPGRWRALPATLRPTDDPSAHDALGEARTLEVLAPGEPDPTPYEWSRAERVAFGVACFNDGDHALALEHLGTVPAEARRHYGDVVRALLWIRCRADHWAPAEVVDLFELMGQHWPDVVIPYEVLLAVGRAYHEAREDEAACHLWRAALESSFRDDLPVAQELESAGEYLRAVDYLYDLYWEYPDLPLVVESLYGLGQDVYAHKAQARDQSLGLASVRPHELVGRAAKLLAEFLDLHPDAPYADEAAFSLANAHRELRDHEACLARAEDAAGRWPKGDYADRFRYLGSLAAFDLGRYEAAVEAAQAVARKDGPDSRNATFLLAQMCQALGRSKDALKHYQKVREEFPDAALAIDYLERRSLDLPEVVAGDGRSPLDLEVGYCNAPQLEVLAYRVDLMRLFLKEKNLDRVARVNLAGINPTSTFKRPLPAMPVGATGRSRVPLPFTETGAYLVLGRAGEAFASALALVTPLSLEVQQFEGACRVTVLEGEARKPAPDVHVKASDGSGFVAAQTDLRGCATLPMDTAERVTVVARRGKDEYAFWRSRPRRGDEALPSMDVDVAAPSFDADLQEANQEAQARVAQQLRCNFSRRSREDQGVTVAQARR